MEQRVLCAQQTHIKRQTAPGQVRAHRVTLAVQRITRHQAQHAQTMIKPRIVK